ncbi:MAG: plastocyanin/azurin family copper-binding protein [Pseudomonadota bacterium]
MRVRTAGRYGVGLIGLAAVGFCLGWTAGTLAREVVTIDQITDHTATSAMEMFRFAPDFVEIAPGESVVFLNSRGSHTVKSQEGLWPEGAPTVDISGQLRAEVVFDAPGLYGLICGRHGKYGMAMLVVVGDVSVTDDDRAAIEEIRGSERARATFRKLFDQVGS